MTNKSKHFSGFKIQPGHMPVGTRFKVKVEMHTRDHADDVFTVKNVFQNGIRSYVAETTTAHKSIEDLNYTFNLSHVSEILERGDGTTEIATYSHQVEFQNNLLKDALDDNREYRAVHDKKIPKKYLMVSGIRELILWYFGKTGNKGSLNMDKALAMVNKFEGVNFKYVSLYPDSSWATVCLVDYEWLKRFIQRNANRMLGKLDVAEKEEENDYRVLMEKELDAEE